MSIYQYPWATILARETNQNKREAESVVLGRPLDSLHTCDDCGEENCDKLWSKEWRSESAEWLCKECISWD